MALSHGIHLMPLCQDLKALRQACGQDKELRKAPPAPLGSLGMTERHVRQIIEQFMRYTDPDEERRDVLSKVQLFCRSIKVEFLSAIKMGLHLFVKKSSLYINFGPC